MQEIEAKFHIMAALLPDARKNALWQMKDMLLKPDVLFSDLLALVHPAIDARDG